MDSTLGEVHPADVADNQIASSLIEELPAEALFALGDTQYVAENLREKCEQTKRLTRPQLVRARLTDHHLTYHAAYHALITPGSYLKDRRRISRA